MAEDDKRYPFNKEEPSEPPMRKVCAGGCRSYSFFANGGRLYENPLCPR